MAEPFHLLKYDWCIKMILDEKIHQKIREAYDRMNKEGRLPSADKCRAFDDLRFLRFHLIKILQNQPQENNKEAYIRLYGDIALELGITRRELLATLDEMNSRLHRYWRVGTTRSQEWNYRSVWNFMRDGNYVSIGSMGIDDLSDIAPNEASKEEIRVRLNEAGYKSTDYMVNIPFRFVTAIQEGDLVLASRSLKVLGIGRVVGRYHYEGNDANPFTHRLPVEWISLEEWTLPSGNKQQPRLFEIHKPEWKIEIERRILNSSLYPYR